MDAWEGSHPKPSSAVGWADWLEGAVSRVTTCDLALAKSRKKQRSALIHIHTKNICLAEAQLQEDPKNPQIREILSNF
jgi:hypothetical protein